MLYVLQAQRAARAEAGGSEVARGRAGVPVVMAEDSPAKSMPTIPTRLVDEIPGLVLSKAICHPFWYSHDTIADALLVAVRSGTHGSSKRHSDGSSIGRIRGIWRQAFGEHSGRSGI